MLESLLSVIYPECYSMDLGHAQSLQHMGDCPGFNWHKVNFLPSSWYSALFRI